jgi:hypothetical protein
MKSLQLLLLFASFLVLSCVPVELDNIEAFRYTFPELETVKPLPQLTPANPVPVPFVAGEIVVTKDADELVVDVIEAVLDDNITQENLDVIEVFSTVTPEVETDNLIETVTNTWIQGVLSGAIQPSVDLVKVADQFKKDPFMLSYLPQLQFPKVNGVTVGGRLLPLEESFEEEIGIDSPELRLSTLVTPCKAAADELYAKNVAELEGQAASQRTQIRNFYDPLRAAATAAYATRLVERAGVIAANTQRLSEFIFVFNTAVDNLDYPLDVIRGLKIYVVAFVIDLRAQIVIWSNAFELAAQVERDLKLAAINKLQEDEEKKIAANLKAALDEQRSVYNNAVNNCHNQGAGG